MMSGMNDIDINQLVNNAMKYQSISLNRYKTNSAIQNKQISLFGGLQGLLSDFQSKLTNLTTAFNTPAFQLTSSDTSVATFSSLGNNLQAGDHSLVVSQLAQAETYTSVNNYASKTSALGLDETITLTNTADNTKNVSIKIDATDTLSNIQTKINNAASTLGINASILTSTDTNGNLQYSMILGAKTGTANQFTLTSDAGSSGFANFTETTQAKDALFTFDGLNEVRSSNTITDVLDDLSITINNTGSTILSVKNENSNRQAAVSTGIQNLLDSYNSVIQYLDANQAVKVQRLDINGNQTGDYESSRNDVFSNIKNVLSSIMQGTVGVSSNIQSMTDLGLRLKPGAKLDDPYETGNQIPTYGSMQIDTLSLPTWDNETRLNYNLDTNFTAVQAYFTDPQQGLIKKMNDAINNQINGQTNQSLLWNANQQVSQQSHDTDALIDRENDRLKTMRNNFYILYSKLNGIMSHFDDISKYLDGMVTNLQNTNKFK